MRVTACALLGFLGLAVAQSNNSGPASTWTPPQHFRNVNLVRNINLEKNYVRETVNVVIENIDSKPQLEYYLAFEHGAAAKVGGVEVRDKKQPEHGGFAASAHVDELSIPTDYYKISLPKALAPKEQQTLSITYSVLASLKPRPAAIPQNDKQYIEYTFSAFAPSAYTTQKQKTKLNLPTTDVPDASVVPAEINADGKIDPQKQGKSYTYGPYNEQAAGAERLVSVRYEYTHPLTHVHTLERDVEVSHWGGNVATEERIRMTNNAATIKSQFSRVAHQQALYYNPPIVALKEMRFPLPIGSIDAYFTDDIGNVSTSRFRVNPRESNLELTPRYPIFGGWNYNFVTGWNADSKLFLRRAKGASSSFVLKVPVFEGPKQNEGVEYEKIVTRIILPEGASNVNFETDMPLSHNYLTTHKTFMDTVGRTTLVLEAKNIVDEFRDRQVIVTYDYTLLAALRKPLVIFAGLSFVFVASWIIGNLDVSIGKKKLPERFIVL